MIKYKLYTFSGAMYVVPLDKYEYVDDIAESYFEDYCAGLLTSHELDRFVEECIIDNGGKCFDIWCDDYYVIMNKEWWNIGLGINTPPFQFPKIILGKFLDGGF